MNIKKQIILIGVLEKFAFNGMRAMLTIMLVRSFRMLEQDAFQFYAVSLMLSFLVPILAGLLIKRGERDLTVMKTGGLLLVSGFILLLVSKESFLHAGVALIVLGSGLIRANVPAILGKHLSANDNADSAYSLLYVGFNVGTLAGSLLFATLGEIFGWEISFMLGALAGLGLTFVLTQLDKQLNSAPKWGTLRIWSLNILAFLGLLLASRIPVSAVDVMMSAVMIVVPFILVWPLLAGENVKKGLLLLSLIPSIVIFFALYEQAALSLVTFTDGFVDRRFLGQLIPTTMFQGIDPFFNIILGLILTLVWKKVSLPDTFSTSFFKIVIGLIFTWMSFVTLTVNIEMGELMSPLVLWSFFLIIVTGELFIVPVLLSIINSSMSKERASLNMSLVFVLIGASMWLAQYLIRVEGPSNLDASYYVQLFQRFSTWASWSFTVPILTSIIFKTFEVLKKRSYDT